MRETLRPTISDCLPRKNPVERPEYTESEVQAIRAVHRGEGTARQQRMLCDWLMRASGKDDTSYRPGDSHDTAFAEGRRFVGTTFVWMLKVAPSRTDPDKIAARNIEDDEHGRADQR